MSMDKQFYFLSPVEVVKVTSQDLEEIAKWCGGSVQETESRRVAGRMDKYVQVPTPKSTDISWAFPGMYITRRLVITVKDEIKATYAVFRRDYFGKNYFDTPKEATDKTWERYELEKAAGPKGRANITVNVNVGQALLEAQRALEEANAKLEAAGLAKVTAVEELEIKPDKVEHEVVQEIEAPAVEHDHNDNDPCDENCPVPVNA